MSSVPEHELDVVSSSLKETGTDESYNRTIFIGKQRSPNRWKTNEFSTRKYSWLMLPVGILIEYLVRVGFVYFVVVSILELIPAFGVNHSDATTLPPTIFVLIISCIRECIEEMVRYK